MSEKAVTAIAMLVAGLLAVVIIVGLAQKILDATGVAVALCSVLTGIIGGAFLRQRSHSDNDDDDNRPSRQHDREDTS